MTNNYFFGGDQTKSLFLLKHDKRTGGSAQLFLRNLDNVEVIMVFYMEMKMPKEGQIKNTNIDAYLRASSGSRREKIFRRRPNKK